MTLYPSITILGPTASGKTKLAVHLASELNGEILSADSRQVYRSMDIGTGKDLNDFKIGKKDIPYHLIDLVDAGKKYTINRFQEDFKLAFQDVQSRGKTPIICGGTGLYLESVLNDYQRTFIPASKKVRSDLKDKSAEELKELFTRLNIHQLEFDTSTTKRTIRAIEILYYLDGKQDLPKAQPLNTIIFGIDISREERRRQITKRLKERLDQGMIEEVAQLLASGIDPKILIYYGLEYKYIALFLTDELDRNSMLTKLETEIHRFAKRQMTWFRRMEKNGFNIHWIDFNLPLQDKVSFILGQLQSKKIYKT